MKTEYIDSEIERMTAYEKTNDLSNYGQKILNELRSVKKQLTLTDVSQQRELLLAYEIYNASEYDKKNNMEYLENLVDNYLANNCG